MRYSNWADGEHNGGKRENCVEMHSTSGKWNDVACSSYRAHICQRDIKSKLYFSILDDVKVAHTGFAKMPISVSKTSEESLLLFRPVKIWSTVFQAFCSVGLLVLLNEHTAIAKFL